MDVQRYRFDPIDHQFMRLRGRLSPGERLQAMLAGAVLVSVALYRAGEAGRPWRRAGLVAPAAADDGETRP